MNKDRVKGKIDEAVGGAKRSIGSLTGNRHLQAEGIVQQAKGKLENAWGHAKDAVQDATAEAAVQHDTHVGIDVEHSDVVTSTSHDKK